MTRILEGTWAEIAAHADEWNGRHLRVEIEEKPDKNGASPNDSHAEPTLYEVMKDLVGTVSFEPNDLGARSEAYFVQAMDEKHPRGEK